MELNLPFAEFGFLDLGFNPAQIQEIISEKNLDFLIITAEIKNKNNKSKYMDILCTTPILLETDYKIDYVENKNVLLNSLYGFIKKNVSNYQEVFLNDYWILAGAIEFTQNSWVIPINIFYSDILNFYIYEIDVCLAKKIILEYTAFELEEVILDLYKNSNDEDILDFIETMYKNFKNN